MDQPDESDEQTRRRLVEHRLELLDALLVALDRRDEMLRIAGDAADAAEAGRRIEEAFGLNEAQATAVLDLQVRRFSASERERVRGERDRLRAEL